MIGCRGRRCYNSDESEGWRGRQTRSVSKSGLWLVRCRVCAFEESGRGSGRCCAMFGVVMPQNGIWRLVKKPRAVIDQAKTVGGQRSEELVVSPTAEVSKVREWGSDSTRARWSATGGCRS